MLLDYMVKKNKVKQEKNFLQSNDFFIANTVLQQRKQCLYMWTSQADYTEI